VTLPKKSSGLKLRVAEWLDTQAMRVCYVIEAKLPEWSRYRPCLVGGEPLIFDERQTALEKKRELLEQQ
jgi:hypothetical protein